MLTGNLPSWPEIHRGNWVNIEADLYRDGDEDDHEALSSDIILPGGRRLIVGRDVEVLADRQELMGEAALWGLLVGPPVRNAWRPADQLDHRAPAGSRHRDRARGDGRQFERPSTAERGLETISTSLE